MLCENHDGVIFLMDFLLGCESEDGKHSAALPIVAALIAEQLEWVKGAEDSFAHFQGEPSDWLKIQIAEHGDSHRLLGPHESEMSKGADLIDPLHSVKEMTEAEGVRSTIDQSNPCQLDWSDVNDINTEAVEAVAKLMRLAVGGDKSSVGMLRDLAVGITRHLHDHHCESMEYASEFPVVLSAGNEQRRQEIDQYKALPIGKKIGFPHLRGKKTGASYDDSPAGFWRDTQFLIDAIRRLIEASPGDISSVLSGDRLPFNVSLSLLEKIAALPNFGAGDQTEWLGVSLEFIESNPRMVPDWIRARTVAGSKGGKQRGLGALWDGEIRKGFRYCWPPPKMEGDL
jgi:hypothetical protein